jgi:hypothetical protein
MDFGWMSMIGLLSRVTTPCLETEPCHVLGEKHEQPRALSPFRQKFGEARGLSQLSKFEQSDCR